MKKGFLCLAAVALVTAFSAVGNAAPAAGAPQNIVQQIRAAEFTDNGSAEQPQASLYERVKKITAGNAQSEDAAVRLPRVAVMYDYCGSGSHLNMTLRAT